MKQNLETKVGLFLMFGIAVICTLIVFFGAVSDVFKPCYKLTLTFPDASGLLKGSEVYLSGAQVGKVTTDPQPVPDSQKVQVSLLIDQKVRIRQDAEFTIGSSGLLGDRFVNVQPHEYPPNTPDDQKSPFVASGAFIEGAPTASIQSLANSVQPLISTVTQAVNNLNEMINKLNKDVLSGTGTQELKDTISDLHSVMKNANELLKKANGSQGPLGLFINDRESAESLKITLKNLQDLSANLKEHGVLFYSDSSKDAASKDTDKKKKK